jgi:hypothetical protein
MKVWVVGSGSGVIDSSLNLVSAGGVAYKTWSVSGGQILKYAVGNGPSKGYYAADSLVKFNNTVICGCGAAPEGGMYYNFSTDIPVNRIAPPSSFYGGDGGANGGVSVGNAGGAVGGNGAALTSCGVRPMNDIDNLKSILTIANIKTTEDCSLTLPAFGSGAYYDEDGFQRVAGYGGGASLNRKEWGKQGAVILYFT